MQPPTVKAPQFTEHTIRYRLAAQAHRAYINATDQDPETPFEAMPAQERRAWEAAAIAVIDGLAELLNP